MRLEMSNRTDLALKAFAHLEAHQQDAPHLLLVV